MLKWVHPTSPTIKTSDIVVLLVVFLLSPTGCIKSCGVDFWPVTRQDILKPTRCTHCKVNRTTVIIIDYCQKKNGEMLVSPVWMVRKALVILMSLLLLFLWWPLVLGFLKVCCVLSLSPTLMATKVILEQLITNGDRLKSLVDEAKEAAFQHGLIIRTPETPNSSEVGAITQVYLHSSYLFC